MNNDILEYIIENRHKYRDALRVDTIAKNDYLQENPHFQEFIETSYHNLVNQVIVDDVTKNLAVSTEEVYITLDTIDVNKLLEYEV